MARPVFSHLFATQKDLAGLHEYVNAGPDIWVIRDITFFAGAPVFVWQCFIQDHGGTTFAFADGPPVVATFVHWQGRQVIEPPGSFFINVDSASGIDVRVSGYVLTP